MEHKNIIRNQKSVQEVSKHGKTDVRYWQSKLFKPWYTRDGKRFELDQYAVKIQHLGQRVNFALDTPNKAAAAAKAREIYMCVHVNGWDAALEKFKPKSKVALKTHATVGDFLDELRLKADLKPKTLEDYSVSFRKIVADAFKINGENERFDYHKGGRDRWRKQVHSIKLADITPARIQEWKRAFLAKAGSSPAKQRTARISVNSFMRRAKALFALRNTKHLETVKLPSPLPFEGVDFEKRPSMRYRSSFDIFKLIGQARSELATEEPEQFKIFLLATMAGLRRKEIDTLEWSAFRWDKNAIRIEATEWFHPKSEDSIGDVEVDPELIELFRGYRAKAPRSFVIESPNDPRPDATFQHYRCQYLFKRLSEWLRKNGVKAKTPLHTLRKEFGSQICSREGIYAASVALRHANIGITSEHYLDKKKSVVSGMGYLLKDDQSGEGDEPDDKISDITTPAREPLKRKAGH